MKWGEDSEVEIGNYKMVMCIHLVMFALFPPSSPASCEGQLFLFLRAEKYQYLEVSA